MLLVFNSKIKSIFDGDPDVLSEEYGRLVEDRVRSDEEREVSANRLEPGTVAIEHPEEEGTAQSPVTVQGGEEGRNNGPQLQGGQQLGTESPTSQKPPEIPWGRVLRGSSECLQVAIVTGGATGIGYSAAYKLLKHGAKCVVISSRRKEKGVEAVEKLNGRFGKDRALFIQGDVNDEKHFRCLFEEPIRRYGQVDVLFNNAGMLEDRNWQLAVDTNLTSLIRGNFLAFEYMGKNNNHHGGIVVNNASIVGLQTLHGAPVYSATNQTGIRVVALCPGVTETVLVTDVRGKQYNPDWGKEADRLLSSLPTQSTSVTGLAFVDLIRYAPSGTIWVIENSQLLRADLPDRHSYSTVAAKYK
uniref:Uncharacterized protein n=1 Tax=Timema genevievae TaxID=629358 RepID=A0A7R9PML0_TIMGE|nr:unnamed protein product [Timema genevievae]